MGLIFLMILVFLKKKTKKNRLFYIPKTLVVKGSAQVHYVKTSMQT